MNNTVENKNTGAGVPKNRLDYTDSMLLLEIEGLARDGFDDCQIAEILDVGPEAFSKNKRKRHPDGSKSLLSLALERGRRPLSVLVENALYKRAIGQIVKTKATVTRFLELPDGTVTDTKIVQVTETETELPGDVNAQTFWLKHHKPDMYNVQPIRVDMTTKGNELQNEPPRITLIQHIAIPASEANKMDDNFDVGLN